MTLSAGNTVATSSKDSRTNSVAVLGETLTGGVHYWELQWTAGIRVGYNNQTMFGVCKGGVDLANTNLLYKGNDMWLMHCLKGGLFGNGKHRSDEAGAFAQGDRLGCRLDLGARTLSFFKNGAPHGPGHTGVVGPVKRCVEMLWIGNAVTVLGDVAFLTDAEKAAAAAETAAEEAKARREAAAKAEAARQRSEAAAAAAAAQREAEAKPKAMARAAAAVQVHVSTRVVHLCLDPRRFQSHLADATSARVSVCRRRRFSWSSWERSRRRRTRHTPSCWARSAANIGPIEPSPVSAAR